MARGRHPDTKAEPSRQLENQRAFRRRRAEYLVRLQDTVTRLEEENQRLRQSCKTKQEHLEFAIKAVRLYQPQMSTSLADENCPINGSSQRQTPPSIENVDAKEENLFEAISSLKDVLTASTSSSHNSSESPLSLESSNSQGMTSLDANTASLREEGYVEEATLPQDAFPTSPLAVGIDHLTSYSASTSSPYSDVSILDQYLFSLPSDATDPVNMIQDTYIQHQSTCLPPGVTSDCYLSMLNHLPHTGNPFFCSV